jgi:cyclopropane fatty-acyl-phospholipid synthase-like methyltransferase
MDGAAEQALADAVRLLYPHIPPGASVLDVGSGWCGPASQLARERGAKVRGVTISRAQADYCTSHCNTTTLHADMEAVDVSELMRMVPQLETMEDKEHERRYDVALMLESLDHMANKRAVLTKLRHVARTLVLRTGCNPTLARGQSKVAFAGSMVLSSCEDVTDAVRKAGWHLAAPPKLWGAAEAAPTILYWRRRLHHIMGRSGGQLELRRSQAAAFPFQNTVLQALLDSISMSERTSTPSPADADDAFGLLEHHRLATF